MSDEALNQRIDRLPPFAPRIGESFSFCVLFTPDAWTLMQGTVIDIRSSDGGPVTSAAQDRIACIAVLGFPEMFFMPISPLTERSASEEANND